jgi:hypothetical protein
MADERKCEVGRGDSKFEPYAQGKREIQNMRLC